MGDEGLADRSEALLTLLAGPNSGPPIAERGFRKAEKPAAYHQGFLQQVVPGSFALNDRGEMECEG